MVDVPHTALSKGLNGIHVMGWGGCSADQEFGTWPTSYARDLLERWGSHPVGWDCGSVGDGASEWAGLRDKLVSAVQARAAMAGSILASEAWDFVFYVFSEAHAPVTTAGTSTTTATPGTRHKWQPQPATQ